MTKKKYYIFAIVVSIIAVPFICYYGQKIKNMPDDSVSLEEDEYEYESMIRMKIMWKMQKTGI